jgi:hypothetical protein
MHTRTCAHAHTLQCNMSQMSRSRDARRARRPASGRDLDQELERHLSFRVRPGGVELACWRAIECVSRVGSRTLVDPLFCARFVVSPGPDWPPSSDAEGLCALAQALCAGDRLLRADTEDKACTYHHVEAVLGYVGEEMASALDSMADKSACESFQRRLTMLCGDARTPDVPDSPSPLKPCRDFASIVEFAQASRGAVPSWLTLVCALDARAGGDDRVDAQRLADAWIDAFETVAQDSAHRLAEYASSRCGETCREDVLDGSCGWKALTESETLEPLAAEWRGGVARAVRAAIRFGSMKDGRAHWRRLCIAFGWLSGAHALIEMWHARYVTNYEFVRARSRAELPACLCPDWIRPMRPGWVSMQVRTMRWIMRASPEESAHIARACKEIGMEVASREEDHPWYEAGRCIFGELY